MTQSSTPIHVAVPDANWDTRQAERGAHMLQSRSWAAFQGSLGRRAVYAEDEGWSWIGFRIAGRGYSYLYVPYGPTVTLSSCASAIDSMRAAGAQMGVDFVRCEPVGVDPDELTRRGLVSVEAVQPPRTLMLDLSHPDEELWKGVRSGHRNPINRARRSELEIDLNAGTETIKHVVELLEQTAHARGFRSHEPEYYTKMLEVLMPLRFAKIAVARFEGRMVSCAIAFDGFGTRAYAHAGNTDEARKLNSSPALVWALVLDAKASGLNRFDFWGIAAPDAPPNDPWAGFTDFKRGFGGDDVAYAGTWELPVKALKYRALSGARNLARRLRR